eukprot:6262187-Ditylum_brightwellii.AAC.1
MDEEHTAEGRYYVDNAAVNSLLQVALGNSACLLLQHKIDVVQAHLETVSNGYNGNITLLNLFVCPTDKDAENGETFRLPKQESEMRKLFKSVQQYKSFSVANMKREILTRLKAAAMQNGMVEEKQTSRKVIVKSLTMRIFEGAQKQEISIIEKCSDRNSMEFICKDTEKCTALFAEKIGVQNTQSP